jgi:sulfur-oxidizing protein SoxZ
MASKPRVKVPKSAKAGEVITIKTLISHEMESGQRKDKDGNPIPRQIINKFTCEFNGQPVFDLRYRSGEFPPTRISSSTPR